LQNSSLLFCYAIRYASGDYDAKELRKQLKNLSNTEIFDDNFSKYSQRFRHLFEMQTDKAIDLFYQTV